MGSCLRCLGQRSEDNSQSGERVLFSSETYYPDIKCLVLLIDDRFHPSEIVETADGDGALKHTAIDELNSKISYDDHAVRSIGEVAG